MYGSSLKRSFCGYYVISQTNVDQAVSQDSGSVYEYTLKSSCFAYLTLIAVPHLSAQNSEPTHDAKSIRPKLCHFMVYSCFQSDGSANHQTRPIEIMTREITVMTYTLHKDTCKPQIAENSRRQRWALGKELRVCTP